MTARLIALFALLALSLQTAAPAAAAMGGPMAEDGGYAWCGMGAPSAEARAAMDAILEAAGKSAPAGAPGAPHHDDLCALCCSALAAPAALAAPGLIYEPARYAQTRDWAPPAVRAAPRAPQFASHRPRDPPHA